MKTKVCTKCRIRKSPSMFYADKYAKGGFRSECKECSKARMKNLYQTHKVKYTKYNKEYHQTHKNEIAARRKEHYQTHRTKYLKRVKKYQETHKVEIAERNKRYYKTIIGHLRRIYGAIRSRCVNPKCVAYKNYGGRGIKNKFESSDEFVDYVLNKLQIDPRNLQIDRINNNGDYEPGNIRFVTAKENSNNKKR